MTELQTRGWIIADDAVGSTGGRTVLYVLADGRRIPVTFGSGEYSAAAVEDVGDSLARRDRRQPASKGGQPQRAA